MVKGIRTLVFGMAPAALAACPADAGASSGAARTNAGQGEDERCAYPDMLAGVWNETLTYRSPSLITLPHFYQVRALGARLHMFPLLRVPADSACAICCAMHAWSRTRPSACACSPVLRLKPLQNSCCLDMRTPKVIGQVTHRLQADPAVALSTGCAFAADPALHESFSAVEPSAGFTIQARMHAPTLLERLKLRMLQLLH